MEVHEFVSHKIIRFLLIGFFSFLISYPAVAAEVTLAWDPKTDSGLAGYKVYYGTASRAYSSSINVGNVTSYTVTGLTSGAYYFAVSATYSTGAETALSNEVSTTLSVATPTLTSNKTSSAISIDGNLSESGWNQANLVRFSNAAYSDNQVTVKTLWDDTALYLAYIVQDAHREATNASLYQDDGAEVYIDVANNKSSTMDANDYHFAVNINSVSSLSGVVGKSSINSSGYSIEIQVPWSLLQTTPAVGKTMGLLLGNNDRDNGVSKQFDWLNVIATGNFAQPSLWGNLVLGPLASSGSSPLPAPTNVSVK